MEYVYGRKLKDQPPNLSHCLRTSGLCEKYEEKSKWCNDTFGKNVVSYANLNRNWGFKYGSKYYYFFFKTKDDAMQFKLVWGGNV